MLFFAAFLGKPIKVNAALKGLMKNNEEKILFIHISKDKIAFVILSNYLLDI